MPRSAAQRLLIVANMWQSTRFRSVAHACAAAALLALASGCYAEAGAEPAYVEATAAPVNADVAPQYSYEGRTVYYVNDHWYARDRGRWVYYRTEPDTLYRHRTHVREAPRAPDRVYRRHEAPPPPRHEVARPRRQAPDAVRVQ